MPMTISIPIDFKNKITITTEIGNIHITKKNKEMEHWKFIKDFEDYEISTLGNIRRKYKKGYKYRKPIIQGGYSHVTFSKDNSFKKMQIHRLVCLAFIPNTESKPCVNHINGIKTDNRIENLEWCTHSENEKHSFEFLGKITNGIKRRVFNKNKINEINQMLNNGMSQRAIARKLNVSSSTISNLTTGKTYKKHFLNDNSSFISK